MDIKGIHAKHLIMFSVFGFILILLSGISQAATYYVSNSGSATWGQCTNISTPCAVQTAFDNAVAGDIVYFRGGTYNVPAKNFSSTYHGYYEPANSGTSGNPITFAAYTGETPIFNGTAGGSGDVPDFATIMGTQKSYITFDGFSFQSDNGTKMARIIVWGNGSRITDVTFNNININGGSTAIATQDNRETIRLENANNILVKNSKIYNARSTTNYEGINGIKTYSTSYVTVENCEIYNTQGAIYLKSDTDSWIIRNNWIHDNYIGIYITPYQGSQIWNANNHKISNNVIANNSYMGILVYGTAPARANNLEIHNNTLYSVISNSYGMWITEGDNLKVYNNIIQGSASNQLVFGYGNYYITESNYNQFGSYSFRVITHMYNNIQTYSSLTAWKASGEIYGGGNPDLNSLASNPLFTNASGTLTQLKDFKLASTSSSKGTGKGGVDMGANIAQIGTGAPSLPKNLQVQ